MQRAAVLLTNLGSPQAPETRYVKPYLRQFLMDERVIDVPLWLRTILVKGLIVPFRAARSAAKYRSIWSIEGSPLIVHTEKQTCLLKEKTGLPVYYSMRYGHPSSETVLKKIHSENPLLKSFIVLPLYPHYAMSSYETAVVQIKQLHAAGNYSSSLQFVAPYYNAPLYIYALGKSIEPYLSKPFDHILFSYHGIPERHVKKADCTQSHCLQTVNCCETPSPAHARCYRHQVIATTNLVAAQLGLRKDQFSFSFQSRLGRDAWLKPFTAVQLKSFPARGIKRLLIVCPAFTSDCLETLEEIEIEGKEVFLNAGGEAFTMIPALDENTEWIDCMKDLVENIA